VRTTLGQGHRLHRREGGTATAPRGTLADDRNILLGTFAVATGDVDAAVARRGRTGMGATPWRSD
jgi:hypothetical protein